MFFITYTSTKDGHSLFKMRSQHNRDEYREFSFTLGEVRSIIGRILNRKMRRNGVGKSLMFDLFATGSCEVLFGVDQQGNELGFRCESPSGWRSGYRFSFFGRSTQYLINRLNDPKRHALALAATVRVRDIRRDLRKRGLWREPPRTTATQNRLEKKPRFTRHFKKSVLMWSDAVHAIACATKQTVWWVQTHLYKSLTPEGVAAVCVYVEGRGNFSFRVNVANYRGLVSSDAHVQLETTRDEAPRAYRNLRNALRRTLNRERKEKQKVREQVRAFRKAKRRMQILASM